MIQEEFYRPPGEPAGQTLKIVRCDSLDPDFRELVRLLDADLAVRDGAEHAFYAQFNKIEAIRQAVVAYDGPLAAGCGAFRPFDAETVEIKRMFVRPERRGRQIGAAMLGELERWARECGFRRAVLETGLKQPEAIRLYEKSGYLRIPNYGPYENVADSVCLKKTLGEG